MSVITIYLCGNCEEEHDSYDEADECCDGEENDSSEPKPPTAAELEALGQQKLL